MIFFFTIVPVKVSAFEGENTIKAADLAGAEAPEMLCYPWSFVWGTMAVGDQAVKTLTIALALIVVAGSLCASDSPIAGIWTAELHDKPAIKLTVNDDGGKLSGNIIFYFLMLENGSWKVKDGTAINLIDPRLEGKTFEFAVPHAKKHGSTEPADQEIKTFRMQLTGKNQAVFKNAADDGGDLILKRTLDQR